MEAMLEAIRRRPVQGEEQEIAHDLPCEIDPGEGRITLRTERDLGVRIGDEVESDALDRKMAVRSVRKERTESGYRIVLECR